MQVNKLKGVMAEHGLSATSLSKKIGKNKTWLTRRLNSEVKLKIDDIKMLSSVLNLTTDEILNIFFTDSVPQNETK